MNTLATECIKAEILIVDDTPDNLRLLSRILMRQGYEVRKALNGQMALASAQINPPDLILLDIRMPYMTGYEICEALKADPTTCEVPVIFISALDDVLDKVRAFSVGGVDYVTKPFQEAEVLARVENQLRLRHLQRQLQLRNQALERSNRELEQFAHVVSHDLQQPLQSITGFTRLMQLGYPDLDEKGQQYLQSILEAGGRMQRLITDLLGYAQADQLPARFDLVDCNLLLQQVLQTLSLEMTEKQVVLETDTLPTVRGSDVQLLQLLQNLIGNAIKFLRPGVHPQIRLTVTPQGQQWLFALHDNGIGIEPDKLNHVFEVFQRTQAAKQYPGSGIGLATCKRIVENHGGQIWAESQVNQGTTFYFTLPRQPIASVPPTHIANGSIASLQC